MTGTAETEAAEFEKIYKLEIVVIPTNKPMLRIENPDVVFRTAKEKYMAVADEIAASARDEAARAGRHHLHRKVRAALATSSSARACATSSSTPSSTRREAEIVAQAGRLGMVTIATNMAGRGTDILLGGNSEFMARQDLVKKSQARAVSRRRRRHLSHRRPRLAALLLPGPGVRDSAERLGRGHRRRTPPPPTDEHEQVIAAGGLLHPRHRAPRVPPRRQPAPRPRRPPGRSRRLALLPLARRRPHAHLRQASGSARCSQRLGMEEGVPIESPHDLQAHRGRAEGRRSAELRVAASTCSSTTTS